MYVCACAGMSKTKMSRDRRSNQPGIGRVTRSSVGSQESAPSSSQQSKPSDVVLLDDLSLMRVSELQASLARCDIGAALLISLFAVNRKNDMSSPYHLRKGKSPKAGTDVSKSTSGRSVPQGALETVGRLMKLGRLRNVVVVAGAGISTASGIPDFR